VDDVNNMDESMNTDEQPLGRAEKALRTGLDRRTMLKAAVATGTIAATWVAPRIETLGFAPAFAFNTPCIILSPASDDKNSNGGQTYCPIPTPTKPCCGQSFGDSGKIDRFTFTNPIVNCSEIVVRTIALDCNDAGDPFGLPDGNGNTPERNPDIGQFAVVIDHVTESVAGACGKCKILDAVLIASSGRTVLQSLNNGPVTCAPAGAIGDGVDASVGLCTNPNVSSSSRLAVRLTCQTGVNCPPS